MNPNEIIGTANYIDLARHCIGLDHKKPYHRHGKTFYRPYRNYYAAGRAQPANDPLTLDELRGMDGEPVWVADNRSGSSAWMQYAYEEAAYDLIAFWEFGSEVESAYCALDYGKTWLAYRRKPEGSDNHA